MKSLLLAIAITSASFSFASEPANKKIIAAFKADFSTVSSVNWKPTTEKGVYEGVFTLNESEVHVFYNEDGEMIGSSRFIGFAQLPLLVQQAVTTKYQGYAKSTVIERVQDGSTTYFVNLQNEKSSLMVASSTDGQLSIFKKTRRK